MNNTKKELFKVLTEETDLKVNSAKMEMKIFSHKDLLQMDIPPQEFIVESLIPEGGITMISGKPGVMKSYLSLYISKCISKGEPLFGVFNVKKENVLYADFENSLSGIRDRASSLEIEDIGLYYLYGRDYPTFKIENLSDIEGLIKLIKSYEIKFLVFDSFIDIHRSREDVSNDMQVVFENLRKIVNVGCTILLIHHHRKGNGSSLEEARGSGGILAALDAHFTLTKNTEDRHKLIVKQVKNRYEEELKDFEIQFITEDGDSKFEYLGEKLLQKDLKVIDCEDSFISILSNHKLGLLREELFQMVGEKGFSKHLREDVFKELKVKNKIISKSDGKKYRFFLSSENLAFPISQNINNRESGKPEIVKLTNEYSMDEILNTSSSIYKHLFENGEKPE